MDKLKQAREKSKIDQIIDLVKLHKTIPSATLAERIYGDSSPANLLKLQKLISVCRVKGGKSKNIYCIRGCYLDISSIFNENSES